MLKSLFDSVKNFVLNKEPVAVFTIVSGAVLTWLQEAQGSLTGKDAWVAVGVAIASLVTRQLVTPAGKKADAEQALEWLKETGDLYRGDVKG